MGSLLHPVGSEPEGVYWMRRAAVVVGALVVLGVAFLLFRPSDTAPVTATPASSTPTTTPTVTPTGTPSPTASPTPTGPVVCDASTATVSLAGYQKVKQGAKQSFKVVIANSGKVACVLNLSSTNFALEVTSGSDRIWSTADCVKWVPAKKVTLKPSKTHEFGLEWSLVRSGAGCKTTKDVLKPGTYVATATFAESLKARQVFNIVKGD